MARYREAVCRLCRRESLKLFLKGDRCYTDKCAIERRPYSPGQHGQRRRKVSEFGHQLREKQKLRSIYGIVERQFRNYFDQALKMKGVTGDNLLLLLERRLDNIVYRLGFANSRQQARQLITQRHFLINGRPVNMASYLVKVGDEIQIAARSQKLPTITESMESVERRGVSEWLLLEKDKFKGKVMALPLREQLTLPIQEQLVVELYSK